VTQVRTKFTTGEVHEVGPAELLDLDRQGLLYSHELDADAATEAGISESSHKWKSAEEAEEPKPVKRAGRKPKAPKPEPVKPDTFTNPDGTVVEIPADHDGSIN